jgi:hypothetical protein
MRTPAGRIQSAGADTPARYWRQPDEVWINKPIEEPNPMLELTLVQAT